MLPYLPSILQTHTSAEEPRRCHVSLIHLHNGSALQPNTKQSSLPACILSLLSLYNTKQWSYLCVFSSCCKSLYNTKQWSLPVACHYTTPSCGVYLYVFSCFCFSLYNTKQWSELRVFSSCCLSLYSVFGTEMFFLKVTLAHSSTQP